MFVELLALHDDMLLVAWPPGVSAAKARTMLAEHRASLAQGPEEVGSTADATTDAAPTISPQPTMTPTTPTCSDTEHGKLAEQLPVENPEAGKIAEFGGRVPTCISLAMTHRMMMMRTTCDYSSGTHGTTATDPDPDSDPDGGPPSAPTPTPPAKNQHHTKGFFGPTDGCNPGTPTAAPDPNPTPAPYGNPPRAEAPFGPTDDLIPTTPTAAPDETAGPPTPANNDDVGYGWPCGSTRGHLDEHLDGDLDEGQGSGRRVGDVVDKPPGPTACLARHPRGTR